MAVSLNTQISAVYPRYKVSVDKVSVLDEFIKSDGAVRQSSKGGGAIEKD